VTIDDQRLDSQPCAGENAAAISLTNINVNFPGANGERLEVLKNVNLTVADESIVALLGASGAGKSTLLNVIAGLVKPDSGRVCICGAPSDEQNDWCAASYMFQDERLLPWRTAIRNVEFALEAGSTPKAERVRRSDAALRLVGLETFERAFPYQLSGGMRRRARSQPRHRAENSFDGRAVLAPRRADARPHAPRAPAHSRSQAHDRRLRHARRRRGGASRRRSRGDVAATRHHSRGGEDLSAAATRSRGSRSCRLHSPT
jgi:ABC-type uncharacterized transport system YnjBCD ATPase subunit